MSLLFTNNAVSTLAGGIGTGDTSISVQAADGGLFPAPTGNDSFLVTLRDASNNIEIVECTSRSGDALTVIRAREGTTAKAYLSGDAVELSVTAGVLSQYRQGVGDKVTETAINKSLGLVDVHDYIVATAALTITLPDAAAMAEGYQVSIKNNSASGDVTVNRTTGSDTIDGAVQDVTIPPQSSIKLSVNQNENGYITMFQGAPAAYPIGAVFLSAVATNPATLLGFGTWTAVPGRFLVGVGDNGDGKAYTALEEGGAKDAVVVEHNHTITDPGHTHGTRSGANGNASGGYDDANFSFTTQSFSSTTGISINNAGESGVDKNLPPYLGVYIWRRTA